MIFNEIYGCYYETVKAIIEASLIGELDRNKLNSLVRQYGFEESILTIPDALESQKWPFINNAYKTKIKYVPTRPTSLIEKRWLKSLLSDSRIQLFDIDDSGLEDVQPLFKPGIFVYFDQNAEGDPYLDEQYISVFKTILKAIQTKKSISLQFTSYKKECINWNLCSPQALEYSGKDDRFRLRVLNSNGLESTVNVKQITNCELLEIPSADSNSVHYETDTLIFKIINEREALERVLLHFSHFKKSVEKIDGLHYRVSLEYQTEDKKELIIRLLSFGPVVQVISPSEIVDGIAERIQRQVNYKHD